MDPNNSVIKRLWCSSAEKKVKLITFPSWVQSNKKSALEHFQNAEIQIILGMCKVSFGPLLSIHTFCSVQWICKQTVMALIRLCRWAEWPGPLLSAHARRHFFKWRSPSKQSAYSSNMITLFTLNIHTPLFLTIFGMCQAKQYRQTFAKCTDLDHPAYAQSIIWAFALHSYILKYPMILLVDSQGPDQTARMHMLI